MTTAIAVHGGAGELTPEQTSHPGRAAYERALGRALATGQDVLAHGGIAIDAVCAAVTVLEDEPLLNAGRGAVLCADGSIELCAAVMDGETLSGGAVAGVRRLPNPVLAARAMLGHHHNLLVGEAAERFAQAQALEAIDPDLLRTEARVEQWQRLKDSGAVSLDHSQPSAGGSQGTVGAVARDRYGHLAAATSTGGLVNQSPGRIGDSPVLGAGTWADNRVAAVSATGTGDVFARLAFARRMADLIELAGLDAGRAALEALDEVQALGGCGGCIAIDADGTVTQRFNSAQMLRGYAVDDQTPMVAILPNESVPYTP